MFARRSRLARGYTLVATLVVVAIIAVLVIVVYGNGGSNEQPKRADGKGETIIGKAKFAAKDDQCRSNLSQVRAAIAIQTDPVDGTRPQTIEEAKIGSDFYRCPIGKEPYTYDSQTGRVGCPHPGHEGY